MVPSLQVWLCMRPHALHSLGMAQAVHDEPLRMVDDVMGVADQDHMIPEPIGVDRAAAAHMLLDQAAKGRSLHVRDDERGAGSGLAITHHTL